MHTQPAHIRTHTHGSSRTCITSYHVPCSKPSPPLLPLPLPPPPLLVNRGTMPTRLLMHPSPPHPILHRHCPSEHVPPMLEQPRQPRLRHTCGGGQAGGGAMRRLVVGVWDLGRGCSLEQCVGWLEHFNPVPAGSWHLAGGQTQRLLLSSVAFYRPTLAAKHLLFVQQARSYP